MYFTALDYQQIEDYLKQKAYKDTDFNQLPLDLIKDTDIVAIVHNGKNRKINIKILSDKIKELIGKNIIPIDDHMSSTSKNPVQNKVVNNAVNQRVNKKDNLTYWNVNKIIFSAFGF